MSSGKVTQMVPPVGSCLHFASLYYCPMYSSLDFLLILKANWHPSYKLLFLLEQPTYAVCYEDL